MGKDRLGLVTTRVPPDTSLPVQTVEYTMQADTTTRVPEDAVMATQPWPSQTPQLAWMAGSSWLLQSTVMHSGCCVSRHVGHSRKGLSLRPGLAGGENQAGLRDSSRRQFHAWHSLTLVVTEPYFPLGNHSLLQHQLQLFGWDMYVPLP